MSSQSFLSLPEPCRQLPTQKVEEDLTKSPIPNPEHLMRQTFESRCFLSKDLDEPLKPLSGKGECGPLFPGHGESGPSSQLTIPPADSPRPPDSGSSLPLPPAGHPVPTSPLHPSHGHEQQTVASPTQPCAELKCPPQIHVFPGTSERDLIWK